MRIATAPTGTAGIEYTVCLADLPSQTAREFVKIEIIVSGTVWRELLVEVSALDGLIRGLQQATTMCEQASVEADKFISRIKGEAPRSGRRWFKQRAKQIIITLALRGIIPAHLASWLIQRGGLRDA